MGAVDAVWLSMDSPENLMVIEGIMTLDGPVDWQRLADVLQHRLVDRYPVFHQVVVEASNPLGMPHWEDDPDFSIDHHLHHATLPEPGDEAALQAFVERKMQEPIDRSRPLWHFYVIDGYQGGSVVVSRFHHALADGIALAEVLLSLTDAEPDDDLLPVETAPTPLPPTSRSHRPPACWRSPAGSPARSPPRCRPACAVRCTCSARCPAALHPSYAVEALTTAWQTGQIADKLLLGHNPESPLSGPPGLAKRAVWSQPRPLVDIKLVGRAAGATVNDVLVGAVSAAISHYVGDRGGDPADLSTMVPVNVRGPGQPLPRELGNKFALVMLPLPTSRLAPLQRLAESKRRMDSIKHSPEAVLTFGLLTAIGPRQHRRGQAGHRLLRGQGDRGHHQRGRPDDRALPRRNPPHRHPRLGARVGRPDPGRVHHQLRRRRAGRVQGGCRARSPTPRSSCTPSTTRWTPSSGSPPPSDREVTHAHRHRQRHRRRRRPPRAACSSTSATWRAPPSGCPTSRRCEVLTSNDDGTPLTAPSRHPPPSAPTATPSRYEHSDDGMSWHLVEGRLQTGQDAEYVLRPLDDDHTEVTFTLTISHNLPLPGFIRSRTIKGLVANNTGGLVKHFAS